MLQQPTRILPVVARFILRLRIAALRKIPIDRNLLQDHNVVLIMLGEFEYLILASAVRLGEEAYVAAIRNEIEDATQQSCSIGALYTTLGRLETKGLIKTAMGDPTPRRGGRPKRMVRVTAKGLDAATEFYTAIKHATRGISWQANRAGIRS